MEIKLESKKSINKKNLNFEIFYYFLINKKKKCKRNIIKEDPCYSIININDMNNNEKLKRFFNQKFNLNLSKYTELFYINYILNNYFRPEKKSNSKFYWYLFCKKYNLNHPKIYIIKQNNIIFNYLDINPNTYYIIKPLVNNQGNGIIKIIGKKIRFYIEKNNNIIIQEFIKDNFISGLSRHFRLITCYDGDKIGLYIFDNDNNFISNGHKGAKISINLINDYKNNNLKLSKPQINGLTDYINKISNIHKTDYNDCISIGWDLMFNNSKIYILEGNIHGHGVIYKSSNKIDINNYYIKVNDFLNIHL